MTTNEIIWWLGWLERRGLFRAILIIVSFFTLIGGLTMFALWWWFKNH